MKFSLGYGTGEVQVDIPEKNVLHELVARDMNVTKSEAQLVEDALSHPIFSKPLHELVHAGQKVVIVTSDITRPMPSAKVVPQIVRELNRGGIPNEDIQVVFALGSHRAHTQEEMRMLVGDEVFDSVSCIDSDMERCITLGHTPDGTPVDMFEPVAKADVRVLVGNIEYHYFVGYSGGAKALMPGVSSRRAIQHNHRNMVKEEACVGRIEGNPVRADIEAILPFISGDFIVNVVLDEHKRIVYCVAGDVIKAHRFGCDFLDELFSLPIEAEADCVVVSQGGAPKDLNIYQLQKALDNAKHAVKPGGTIVWIGRAQEGYGSSVFEKWVNDYHDPRQCVEEIEKHFELGGHKAAAIAMTALKAKILFYCELEEEICERVYTTKIDDVQGAIDEVLKGNPQATFIVMPFGGSTLPKLTPKA